MYDRNDPLSTRIDVCLSTRHSVNFLQFEELKNFVPIMTLTQYLSLRKLNKEINSVEFKMKILYRNSTCIYRDWLVCTTSTNQQYMEKIKNYYSSTKFTHSSNKNSFNNIRVMSLGSYFRIYNLLMPNNMFSAAYVYYMDVCVCFVCVCV